MRSNLSLALMLLCATPACADTITLAEAHAVVDKEIDLVSKNYVFPEKRAAIVAAIRAKEKAGAYDLTNPAELADKLGGDVIAASNDKHMWMQYDPTGFAALQAPQNDPAADAYYAKLLRQKNYGYTEMKVLPGNIRYVNLVTFNWDAKGSPDAVANAARFLEDGDVAIIDLRDNGGGSGDAVRAMVSYFMPAKKQELMAYHDGPSGKTDYNYVDLKLAAPRMVGKPLYVLISGNTGSAAEEFAYHIKMFKLGTLIGEPTAGAANNNTEFAVAPGFIASISAGRAIHPVSNTNWEGVGVPPDVSVDAGKALDQAEVLALEKLSSAPGADAKAYDWALTGAKAHVAPPAALSAAALAQYPGTYGIRTVALKEGALTFQRQGRPVRALTPLAEDLFAIGDDGETRVKFRHDASGKVIGFDLTTSDGQLIVADRTN